MRFIAIHPVAFTEDQLRPLAKEPMPEGVTWDSTLCADADGLSYCLWLAPGKQDLIEIFKRYDIPYQAIYAVRRFDPATGEIEPATAEQIAQPV